MELNVMKWQGYLRKDGRLGIRNRVLVIYTVKCAEFVARRIVEEAGSLDVELVGFDGCTDNQYAVNLLISLIPAAVMFIPVSDAGFLMDVFTALLQENYLLVTASCCVGSGLFLFIAVWYTRQHYAETERSSGPLSVLRYAIYQLLAHLLPGVSHVSVGSTGLLLCDVEPKVIVREMLLYLAPSLFVNVARIVRYILAGIVLNPVMIALAAVGAGLGSLLMIHLISKYNIRKHFVFFAVYSIVFGLFIAVSAFVF